MDESSHANLLWERSVAWPGDCLRAALTRWQHCAGCSQGHLREPSGLLEGPVVVCRCGGSERWTCVQGTLGEAQAKPTGPVLFQARLQDTLSQSCYSIYTSRSVCVI